jgi:hypothetical protein
MLNNKNVDSLRNKWISEAAQAFSLANDPTTDDEVMGRMRAQGEALVRCAAEIGAANALAAEEE